MRRNSETPSIDESRRVTCWRACVIGLFFGCSFPPHEFTRDISRSAGGATLVGGGVGQAGGVDGGAAGQAGGVDGGAAGQASGVDGGAAAGVSSSVTTPVGGGANEICDNRIDDDTDGRVDCSDPDCTAANWVCLPTKPNDWKGPVAIATATSAATLPNCEAPGGYNLLVSAAWCSKVSTEVARCGSCPACGSVENPTKNVMIDLNPNCTGSCITNSSADCRIALAEGCQRIDLVQASMVSGASLAQLSVKVEAAVISGGTCQSSLTRAKLETPIDEQCREPMKVCAGPAVGSCTSGGSCFLKPQVPFDSVPCIYVNRAETSCPDGWNSRRQIAYANIVDTRGCSDCMCNTPAASAYGKVPLVVTDYALDETCLGSGRASVSVPPGCFGGLGGEFGANGLWSRYLKIGITPSLPLPSCVQSGGQAIGSVETPSLVTICCTSL